jgi:hypothetical protein
MGMAKSVKPIVICNVRRRAVCVALVVWELLNMTAKPSFQPLHDGTEKCGSLLLWLASVGVI